MIPFDKLSKKEQKEINSQNRGSFFGVNPVTKTIPSGKGYNRKKIKDQDRKQK